MIVHLDLVCGLDMSVFVGDTTALCQDLRRYDDNRKTNMMVSSIS